MSRVDHIGCNRQVVVEEFGAQRIIRDNAADLGCGQQHNLRPLFREPAEHRRLIAQVEFVTSYRQQLDVLAREPSILMRPELYVTAAAVSAGLFVLLSLAALPLWTAAAIAIAAGFVLRGAAIAGGWSLPAYRD